MESLTLILDLETQGLRESEYVVTPYEGPVVMGVMPNGTEDEKPTVMIAIEDPETGGFVVIETTLALFLRASDAFKTRHGDPR